VLSSWGLLLSALPVCVFAQSPALEGTDWRLTQLAGSGVPFIGVSAGVDATLRIDGTRAGGKGGCNRWFADVAVDDAQIAFGKIGSTMMACPELAMSIETV
jgi:putative lipoprotein